MCSCSGSVNDCSCCSGSKIRTFWRRLDAATAITSSSSMKIGAVRGAFCSGGSRHGRLVAVGAFGLSRSCGLGSFSSPSNSRLRNGQLLSRSLQQVQVGSVARRAVDIFSIAAVAPAAPAATA
jgi:hypothetical protein